MLRDFYITTNLPGTYYNELTRTLKTWAIDLVAVGVLDAQTLDFDDMTTVLNMKDDVQWLFRVKDAPEAITAHEWLHDMLNEMFELHRSRFGEV